MASILALVSKGIFEKQARKGSALLRLGDVFATASYVSKNKALGALGDGGDLFLVTVRPPDEQLWLVGVLESPTFENGRWTSATNVVPITDVSHLVGALRFSTGKGITAGAGKLGMSLQSPRKLTDDDVALLRAALTGEVAVVPPLSDTADQERTSHSAPRDLPSEVIDELSPLVERAQRAPSKLLKATKAIARKRGVSETTVALYDYVADVLMPTIAGATKVWDKNPNRTAASTAFRLARETERKVSAASGPLANLDRYREAAQVGAIDERELAGWLNLLRKVSPSKAELESVRQVVTTAIASGSPPSARVARALARHDLLGETFECWMRQATASLQTTEDRELFAVVRDELGSDWFAAKPARVLWALAFWPASNRLRTRNLPWLEILGGASLFGEIARHDPRLVQLFVRRLLHHGARVGKRQEMHVAIARIIEHVAPALREGKVTLQVAAPKDWSPVGHAFFPEAATLVLESAFEDSALDLDEVEGAMSDYLADAVSWEYLVNVELVEALVANGIEIAPLPRDVASYTLKRDGVGPHEPLTHLRKHPVLGDRVRRDYPTADGIADRVIDLARNGTIAEFRDQLEELEKIAAPGKLTPGGELAAAFRQLDPAVWLWRTLRAGIMDEWGWPSLDEAHERHGEDVHRNDCGGRFPHRVVFHKETRRVTVADPNEVVFDLEHNHDDLPVVRWQQYVGTGTDADVRLVEWNHPHRSYWVKSGEVTETKAPKSTRLFKWMHQSFWEDEEGRWLWPNQGPVRRDGSPVRVHKNDKKSWVLEKSVRFVGKDGGTTPKESRLPSWFADLMDEGDQLCTRQCMLVRHARPGNPLGQHEGQAGFATIKRSDGRIVTRGFDGREIVDRTGKRRFRALMTFPEREGFYPVAGELDYATIYSPEDRPITPTGLERISPEFWGGGPECLPIEWWVLLQPRDSDGSRALAHCELDDIRPIYDAALAAHREPTPPAEPEPEFDYPDLKVTVKRAPEAVNGASRWPAVAGAVRDALPEVSHPRLVAGIVRMAMTAAEAHDALERIVGAIPSEEANLRRPDRRSKLTHKKAAAVGALLGYDVSLWWNKPKALLGQQMLEVAAFFAFDGPAPQPDERPLSLSVTPGAMPWNELLPDLGHLLWRVLAAGTPDDERQQLLSFLHELHRTGLLDQSERLRHVRLAFGSLPAPGIEREHPDRLLEWDNRYFLRYRGSDGNAELFDALEYAPDGVFRTPPGAEIQKVEKIPHVDAKLIRAVIAAVRNDGPLEATPAIAERLSDLTGLLPPAAGLLWAAAVNPWNTSKKVRRTLKYSATENNVGASIIGRFDASKIYAAAFPFGRADPVRAMRHPLLGTNDEPAVVELLAAAWNEENGRRPPVPLDVVAMAATDFGGAETGSYDMDLRIVQDPDHRTTITDHETWVLRPTKPFGTWGQYGVPAGWPKPSYMGDEDQYPPTEPHFSGWVLRHFPRYVAWAYAELPVGHPVRRGAATLVDRIERGLANEGLLMLAGVADFSRPDTADGPPIIDELISTFDARRYEAADGGEAADGIDRGDFVLTWPAEDKNGFFLSIRPSQLASLEARARLLELLGVGDGGKPITFAGHSIVGGDDVAGWLAWTTPGFIRLRDALVAPSSPEGSFVADPRTSASSVVAEVRLRHALDEDAATLYLQLLSLPDPHRDRLMRINGWSRKRHGKAATTLLDKNLVHERKHTRTRRKLFTSDEVVLPPVPAAAIESYKRPLFSLTQATEDDDEWVPPFGAVVPVCPFAELFVQGWQWITDR